MSESEQPADESKSNIYFVPQQLMMKAFQNWQQIVNQYTEDLLSNRRALDTSGKTLESVMQLKHQADQAMEMAISSMQMPTRSDIELLLQKLSMLENLVRDLNDKVDQLLEKEQELQ
jgi:hypothetical protein